MTIDALMAWLAHWLGIDSDPDEGRRRFMAGIVLSAVALHCGVAPSVALAHAAAMTPIADVLKALYPASEIDSMLWGDDPFLALISKGRMR